MADILEHPNNLASEKPFNFPDGSSVLIRAGDTGILTVAQAVYMLDEVKFRIHTMMKADL